LSIIGPVGVPPLPAAGASEPVAERELAGRVAADLAHRRRTLARAIARVREGHDAEAVHDLRVACRRLIAAMRLWRDLVPTRPRPLRALRRLRREAGEARDLEVHVALLRHVLEAFPAGDRVRWTGLVESLERQTARRLARIAVEVSRPRTRRLMADLVRLTAETPPPVAGIPGDGNGATSLPIIATATIDATLARANRRAAKAAMRGRRALAIALARPENESLHSARIAVKKWRYALEGLNAVGAAGSAGIARLREFQQVLGDIQDRVTLSRRLRRAQRRGSDEAAIAMHPVLEQIHRERGERIERFRAMGAATSGLAGE
jgi:CHAD domain-containing protein